MERKCMLTTAIYPGEIVTIQQQPSKRSCALALLPFKSIAQKCPRNAQQWLEQTSLGVELNVKIIRFVFKDSVFQSELALVFFSCLTESGVVVVVTCFFCDIVVAQCFRSTSGTLGNLKPMVSKYTMITGAI